MKRPFEDFRRHEWFFFLQDMRNSLGDLFTYVDNEGKNLKEFILDFFSTEQGRAVDAFCFKYVYMQPSVIIKESGTFDRISSTPLEAAYDPLWLGWTFADLHMYFNVPIVDIVDTFGNELFTDWYAGHQEGAIWVLQKTCLRTFGRYPSYIDPSSPDFDYVMEVDSTEYDAEVDKTDDWSDFF